MSDQDWPHGPPPRSLPLLWWQWRWSHATDRELAVAVMALAVLLGTLVFVLLRTDWAYTISQIQGATWLFLVPQPALVQSLALPPLPATQPLSNPPAPAVTPTPWIIERVQQVEVHHYYYQGSTGWTESAGPP
ncbi:MAG: hypothetical protein KKA73_18040, partial [Chloroflexi bacterium]|nr:hypothetical protein [Chloroflexota bacterium]